MNQQEFIKNLQNQLGGTKGAFAIYDALAQIELNFPEAIICEDVSIQLATNLAYEEFIFRCSGAKER